VTRFGRCAALLALLGALAAGLGGCWNPFAPPGGDDPPVVVFKERTSPANVLYNLTEAYKNQKAEEYLDCLSEDFIFFLNPKDVEEDPDLEPGYWDKAEERDVHENMFGSGDVDRITLTLTQVGDPVPVDPGDGTGVHYQYKESVDLRVYVGDTEFWANAPSRFEFRIDQDQVGPNGEQLWEICFWYDLNEDERGSIATDVSAERITFSRAKAMFQP